MDDDKLIPTMTKEVKGIQVTLIGDLTVAMEEAEIEAYIDYEGKKYGKALTGLTLHIPHDDPEMIDIDCEVKNVPFQRLRRITGYLVGDMGRWNDAKRSEEHDRVKHYI